ncbi:glutamate 5-kinase [Rhodocaloribacter litoris]|uniref:glutamate 5-kinase n=1 Tax=Rhodocaloribacter litoris TaxID=2558931 RepID=UPI001423672C|nr:glutamate 5-kinase [Rhodocaloribacter litoris]QXD14016.1 glutamate 5-kinase [Rhodocaloribacter litoris]GIV60796.1 MAG: glutamate 5-kinase [Rhodothermaceae bacterium]
MRVSSDAIAVPAWRRAVVKVGSTLVAPEGRCSTRYLLPLARFIAESRRQGRELILVSSGAVAAGRGALADRARRPRSIPEKQALAAVGQPLLMALWQRLFDVPCAQLLLTYDDFADRRRFVNARNTLAELLRRGTLPIVNENDTVAVEELKVGDNDNLAAHVAVLAGADLLIICSDVDGLFEADPRTHPAARLIPEVARIDDAVLARAGGAGGPMATGGMRTKVEAAAKATARGIDTLIVNGTVGAHFDGLLAGTVRGTLFRRQQTPLAARKHWLMHTLPEAGRLVVDDGAAEALRTRGASLLPSGIVDVEGRFEAGDAVLVVCRRNGTDEPVAKGLSQYGDHELRRIRGCQSAEIETRLGYVTREVIIHRDDLVLLDPVPNRPDTPEPHEP